MNKEPELLSPAPTWNDFETFALSFIYSIEIFELLSLFAFLSVVRYAQHPIKQTKGTRTRFQKFIVILLLTYTFPLRKTYL